jgi:hypothetical protein
VKNDITLKAGDIVSVFKPSVRKFKNAETGEWEEKAPPEFVKMELVKFHND